MGKVRKKKSKVPYSSYQLREDHKGLKPSGKAVDWKKHSKAERLREYISRRFTGANSFLVP